jgi:hypothetical protein
MRKGEFMFEIVKTLHEVFRVESTWAFVLIIGMAFGSIAGFFAWITDRSYKNSKKEQAQQHEMLKTIMRPNAVTEAKAQPVSDTPTQARSQTLTDQQKTQITQKIIDRYLKGHKNPPSLMWVNQRLQQQRQPFRVHLTPAPNQQPDVAIKGVYMEALSGSVINNRTDWQFDIQDSSIKSAGDGIVNTNENARFKLERTKIDAGKTGIKNIGSQNEPKSKPPSQQ